MNVIYVVLSKYIIDENWLFHIIIKWKSIHYFAYALEKLH